MSDEIQNIKIRIIGETDFSQVDQSMQKLTASEKHLVEGLKSVDNQAKQTHKTLQDESVKSQQSVDKTGQSFNGLIDKVKGLSTQIPGAFQVQEVLNFGKATQGAIGGIGGMSSAFGVLKVAIASTGIGALVIALVSLASYFLKTDEGAAKLSGIMGGLGATINVVTGYLSKFGKFLVDAVSSAANFQQALKDLGDSIITNLINRFKAVLVLGEAIGKLMDGDFAGATKKATDAFIQFNLGITDGTDKMAAFGEELGKAAAEAYDLALAFDALEDSEREYSFTQAQLEKQITNLIIQAKNRTNGEKERLDIIDKASALETGMMVKVIELAKQRAALIIRENQIKRDGTTISNEAAKAEVENILKTGKLLEQKGQLSDDEAQKEVDALNNIIKLETESANLQERLQNRRDAILEQGQAKRQKAADDRKKQIDKEAKAEEDAANKEKLAYEKLLEYRIGLSIKEQDEVAKSSDEETKVRIEAINNRLIEEQKLLEQQHEYIRNNANLSGSELLLLEEKFQAESKDILEKAEHDKTEIYKKAEQEKTKKTEEENKKREQSDKQSAAIRQQIYSQSYQLVSTIANGFFQLQKENYEVDLQNLTAQQNEELARVGDNKQAQAVINKKYAREAAKLKTAEAQADKEQAEFNILLSTAQAVAKASPVLPLMALAAAIGAAQFAIVASKPIPKYNKGTKSVPGRDTGDDSVLAMLRPGEGVMPVDRMADYKPAFDAIFDRKVPAGFINSIVMDYDRLGRMIPVSGGGQDLGELKSELRSMNKKLDRLQVLEVNMDEKGFNKYLKSENSKSKIENNYFRTKG